MKITINKKMDKSVAARGRIVKLLIPRAGMTYFKVGNAVLDKLLTGRKLKKYFTDEVYIERGDGTAIRTLLYSRRGVKEAEEFTSKHPDAGSKIAVERKRAESAKIKSPPQPKAKRINLLAPRFCGFTAAATLWAFPSRSSIS